MQRIELCVGKGPSDPISLRILSTIRNDVNGLAILTTHFAQILCPNPRLAGSLFLNQRREVAKRANGMEKERASAADKKKPEKLVFSGFSRRGRGDSNPQPPDRQSGTLTN